jgi:hypothetical protein
MALQIFAALGNPIDQASEIEPIVEFGRTVIQTSRIRMSGEQRLEDQARIMPVFVLRFWMFLPPEHVLRP